MEIKELKKVVFQKGDVFLLKLKRANSATAIDRLMEAVDGALVKTGLKSGDVTILIFEQDVEFEIWRSGAELEKVEG